MFDKMNESSEIKAVLFDLDGTLLNTLGDLTDAVNTALNQLKLPLKSEDEVKMYIGNGIGKLGQRAVNHDAEKAELAQPI